MEKEEAGFFYFFKKRHIRRIEKREKWGGSAGKIRGELLFILDLIHDMISWKYVWWFFYNDSLMFCDEA